MKWNFQTELNVGKKWEDDKKLRKNFSLNSFNIYVKKFLEDEFV